MDAHTLELLEFDKVRELLAGYAACSLGKELARQLEPSTDADAIRAELALVSEMVDALGQGQAPPFGGLHDVRLSSAGPPSAPQLTVEQLLEVADTLTCTGNIYRYRMRLERPLARPVRPARPGRGPGAGRPRRSAAASTAAATSSTWPAANWPRSARSSPTWTSACRTRSAACSAIPKLREDPPLSQRHRQRRPLRPARRRQPPPQDPGRRPPHQQHRRDGVHRAGRRRQPQCRAGRPQGRGGPRGRPHPAAAERRGRPRVETARLRHRHARPARPHHRQGPLQPRLSTCTPRTSTPRAGSGCGRPGIRC